MCVYVHHYPFGCLMIFHAMADSATDSEYLTDGHHTIIAHTM